MSDREYWVLAMHTGSPENPSSVSFAAASSPRGIDHAVRAVDLLCHRLDLLRKAQAVLIEHMEMAFLFRQRLQYLFRQGDAALAAFFPDLGNGELTASLLAEALHIADLLLRIGEEGIQRDHHGNAIFLQILDMASPG